MGTKLGRVLFCLCHSAVNIRTTVYKIRRKLRSNRILVKRTDRDQYIYNKRTEAKRIQTKITAAADMIVNEKLTKPDINHKTDRENQSCDT